MKKTYISPLSHAVEIAPESHLLSSSYPGGSIDVELSEDDMGGAEALSQKQNSWYDDPAW